MEFQCLLERAGNAQAHPTESYIEQTPQSNPTLKNSGQ